MCVIFSCHVIYGLYLSLSDDQTIKKYFSIINTNWSKVLRNVHLLFFLILKTCYYWRWWYGLIHQGYVSDKVNIYFYLPLAGYYTVICRIYALPYNNTIYMGNIAPKFEYLLKRGLFLQILHRNFFILVGKSKIWCYF